MIAFNQIKVTVLVIKAEILLTILGVDFLLEIANKEDAGVVQDLDQLEIGEFIFEDRNTLRRGEWEML